MSTPQDDHIYILISQEGIRQCATCWDVLRRVLGLPVPLRYSRFGPWNNQWYYGEAAARKAKQPHETIVRATWLDEVRHNW